jgi:DNA-binding NarL/FixJ family response regulator
MYDDTEFVESAIENGANGYLSKDDEPSEIEKAIYATYETGYYINDRTSKMLIARMVEQGKIQPKFNDDNQIFNDFELRIIQLITQEKTTAEIAEELERSVRTIESTRSAMMSRIGAKNVIGLVMYAVKNKLLEI